MVIDFFKLQKQPFGFTPDDRFLFPSATHQEALAALLYGIQSGCGCMALIARPGMGKTSLLFKILALLKDQVSTVFIFQKVLTPADLLQLILADLGVAETGDALADLQSALLAEAAALLQSGKPVLLVIDEAQDLSPPVLAFLRTLMNFETSQRKMIQIILSGQPQLAEIVACQDLMALRQRISIVARLTSLSLDEISQYIDHRLRAAGYAAQTPLFTPSATALIASHSEGIPRNINNLCFNALGLGCVARQRTIDANIVREVIDDLNLGRPEAKPAQQINFSAGGAPRGRKLNWRERMGISFAIAVAACLLLAPYRRSDQRVVRSIHSANAPGPTRSAVPKATSPSRSEEQEVNVHGMSLDNAVHLIAGRTVLSICRANYGACDSHQAREIKQLNPRLLPAEIAPTTQAYGLPLLAASSLIHVLPAANTIAASKREKP